MLLIWLLAASAATWGGMTSCMCGHFSLITTVGILPAFIVGCVLFHRSIRSGRMDAIISGIAMLLILGLAAKCIIDFLWTGHQPLLGP
ncbi:MAG: hypothetical protein KF712_08885 [Akkermansiaceae bacterium]|nr:hypothetical protein [Akkermansiaceae bacterium]